VAEKDDLGSKSDEEDTKHTATLLMSMSSISNCVLQRFHEQNAQPVRRATASPTSTSQSVEKIRRADSNSVHCDESRDTETPVPPSDRPPSTVQDDGAFLDTSATGSSTNECERPAEDNGECCAACVECFIGTLFPTTYTQTSILDRKKTMHCPANGFRDTPSGGRGNLERLTVFTCS